jgi:hypothetical protein
MKNPFDLLPAFRSRHAVTVLQKFEKQKTFLFASVHCEARVRTGSIESLNVLAVGDSGGAGWQFESACA